MKGEFFVEESSWPGWFFMFVAVLLLFAAYACVQIHRRTVQPPAAGAQR